MPEKDPLSYTALTYGWVVLLASWGGMAGYIRKIKSGHSRPSISELIGELCISGFVGVMTFYFCEAAKVNQVISAGLIGISGHMGSRGIMIMENVSERILSRWLKKWGVGNDRADRY